LLNVDAVLLDRLVALGARGHLGLGRVRFGERERGRDLVERQRARRPRSGSGLGEGIEGEGGEHDSDQGAHFVVRFASGL
jgi:CRISPR/Cas system CSM-associated protein Csm3 (group 7 of RAMP superfamily)